MYDTNIKRHKRVGVVHLLVQQSGDLKNAYFQWVPKTEIIFIFYLFLACKSLFTSVKIKSVEKKRQGGAIMAKCAICEKAAHFGNNVSHSHRRSNKMWKSNVKSVKIKTAEGGARKTYVCTSCLRSGKVERA